MALGLALTGLTHEENGNTLWTLKTVSWWDELELTKDSRFKRLELGSDQLVYESILAIDKIWQLHEKYKKSFLEVFEEDPLENPYRRDRLKLINDLEDKLNDPELRFVNVWVFDWDY